MKKKCIKKTNCITRTTDLMTPNKPVWKSLKHDVRTDYLLVESITNVYHLIQQMKANKMEKHNNASQSTHRLLVRMPA